MGIFLLPMMLGIFVIGFIPTLVLVTRISSSFSWYFRSKIQTTIHFVFIFVAAYFGYENGWSLMNLNFPSAADGFGSDRSGLLFLLGLLLPGIYCFVANCLLFLFGKIYFNAYTE